MRITGATLLIGAALALGLSGCATRGPSDASSPVPPVRWNLAVFTAAPATHPAPGLEAPGVEALFFAGPAWHGKPTRVFAYLGLPAVTPGQKIPAMVLVHGGGSTASAAWVREWTARGYAAISFDLGGNVPANTGGRRRERHAEGGPAEGDKSFVLGDEPPADQWMYHAVGNAMLAHSLLAARPEIDARRIGLTGISWGGVVAAVTAGMDPRLRVVVPVYGCGFLEESERFAAQLAGPGGARWSELWDPRHYLPRATAPMLWVNGTNDPFFQLGMWQRSTLLSRGPVALCIIPDMPHNMRSGWKPPQIAAFVDAVLRDGPPMARCGATERRGTEATMPVTSPVPVARARLHFTRDGGIASRRKWEAAPAAWDAATGRITAGLPPDARQFFLSVTDAQGLTVTGRVTGADPNADLSPPPGTPHPAPTPTVKVP